MYIQNKYRQILLNVEEQIISNLKCLQLGVPYNNILVRNRLDLSAQLNIEEYLRKTIHFYDITKFGFLSIKKNVLYTL